MNHKLFSKENKVPRALLEDRDVAGSAKYKRGKAVWDYVVLWGHIDQLINQISPWGSFSCD